MSPNKVSHMSPNKMSHMSPVYTLVWQGQCLVTEAGSTHTPPPRLYFEQETISVVIEEQLISEVAVHKLLP